MIDCPVSGTGSQAKNRDLVFYASGDKKVISAAGPSPDGLRPTCL